MKQQVRNWFHLSMLICVFAALLISCGKKAEDVSETSASEPGTKAVKKVIAVVPKGTTHEYWKAVHAGAVKASREFGADIVWKGPLKEDDREEQIAVVESFITRQVDGIVLAPLDDTALIRPVKDAVNQDIPVVIFDSDLNADAYTSFVATDNYKGGMLAGEEMVRILDGMGKVAMLRYQEGSASTMKREQGFMDAVAESEGIEVVSSNQYGGATTESAYKAAENLLNSLKTEMGILSIDGIFCPNESTTFGMLRALEDGGFIRQIRFIGFDSSPKLLEGLQEGNIDALVVQNPLNMGYLSVKTLIEHLDGKSVEKRIDTGATLVTRKNFEEDEILDLVSPNLSEWLD